MDDLKITSSIGVSVANIEKSGTIFDGMPAVVLHIEGLNVGITINEALTLSKLLVVAAEGAENRREEVMEHRAEAEDGLDLFDDDEPIDPIDGHWNPENACGNDSVEDFVKRLRTGRL